MLVTTTTATEYRPYQWATEASTLGFSPGQWPDSIPTLLGNGLDFEKSGVHSDNGELIAVVYQQPQSFNTLRVYND